MKMLHVFCDNSPAICSEGMLLGILLITAFGITMGGLVISASIQSLRRFIHSHRRHHGEASSSLPRLRHLA